MVEREILELALKTFGIERQRFMAVEEMAELTKELSKAGRGMDNREAILEEIVDVGIMIDQMMLHYGIKSGEYEKVRVRKLTRLAQMIDDAGSDNVDKTR